MNWQSPQIVILKMDAEIGSYQDDFDPREAPDSLAAASGTEAESVQARA